MCLCVLYSSLDRHNDASHLFALELDFPFLQYLCIEVIGSFAIGGIRYIQLKASITQFMYCG